MNLALHTEGKKKVNQLVISGVRFTKLIINHLKRKHKFHKRPGSPLHLPTEESALGYLKFSFKNTKRVRFGMAISDTLFSEEIRSAPYYPEYVAKQRGATTKTTRKPKPQSSKTTPVAKPTASKTSKSTSSQPSKPTPAPAKPQEKKRKLVVDTTKAPPQAKRAKAGKVLKKRTLPSTRQLVDEFVDEGVPDKEPMYGDEEADTQRAIEESLKKVPDAHGEVPGKGKEKVGEEQAAQRRTPAPTVPSSHEESSSLYAELGLTDSEMDSDNKVSCDINPKAHIKGQAGSDPGKQVEAQAGSDPGVASDSQLPPSHVVHAGPNLEHMNLEVTDTSIQPNPEQMDEEFTTTAYPNVQENLKLLTEGEVRLEEPASSAETLSSLQNLDKELSFTDQFLVEKSQEDEPEKSNTEAEVQSMVMVPIHQDTSSVPLMTTPVMDITDPQTASTTIQTPLQTSTTTTTTTATTSTTSLPLPPPPQPQQGSSDPIIIQRIHELEQHMADLVDANQALEERRDKQGNIIYQLENLDIPRQASKAMEEIIHLWETQDLPGMIREAPFRARFKVLPTSDIKEILLQRMLEENYKAEKLKKMKGKKDSPKTPPGSPPPPPPTPPPSGASGASGSAAPGSSKAAALTEYTAWTTTTSRLKPAASPVPEDNQAWFNPLSEEERPAAPEPAWSIPSSSLPVPINNWAYALASSYESLPENSLLSLTGDIGVFIDWFCKKQGITELTPKHLEGPAYEVVKAFHPDGDRLALSITKMKVASYPGAGLEQMVPDQMWAEEEYMYDISASYVISHWWFKRQQLYIDRHSADTNRRAIIRTHMRILSVVSIDVFSIYGYDYMNKIALRRADNQEYTIAESDFKDLYPSDFENLYLLNLQGHLNHLPPRDMKILSSAVNLWIMNLVIRQRVEDFQLNIESYQTQLNLTKPRWEATSLEFMHDYKILDSPRAVLFRDKYGMQMLMRFNKIHKFSDESLQQIDEALDYRVKEFKVNKNNPTLNTRFLTMNDVIKCKQFMFAIQKRLKLRRIFRNLESFVGGRIREGDYRLLRNGMLMERGCLIGYFGEGFGVREGLGVGAGVEGRKEEEEGEEPSGDDTDDEDEDEDEDEEEKEEHPASADFILPIYRMTARISIRDEPSMYEIRESSTAAATRPIGGRRADYGFVGYGIRDVWVDPIEAVEEVAPMTLEGVNARVTELTAVQEQDTDRPVHRRLAVMIEREAKMAREAWGLSMDASDYARSDVMSLRTTVVAQSALISELQSADHRRQRVISELLASDHKRQVQLTKTLRLLKGLQTQMVEFQRQHGPAKGPAQPDAPGEAGSSS
ncbi:hypothetical protein Tco_0809601 [Tanacetum coccineum]